MRVPTAATHLGRGRAGRDRGTEVHAELDCRKADASAGAEHDQLVALLHTGRRPQSVISRAVSHAKRRGGALVDAVRYPRKPCGRRHDLLGEGAVESGAADPVPDRETTSAVAGLDAHTRPP